MDHEAHSNLLEKTQAIMEVEMALTETLERVEPWLLASSSSAALPNRPRVRPIPTNMEQAKKILAVARSLAARTSAPAGWNPNAPVLGFSTPNPLPHQLRGGALAALQLERAKQAERDRKRQRIQQQKQQQQQQQAEQEKQQLESSNVQDVEMSEASDQPKSDPKRREVQTYEQELQRSKSDLARSDQQQAKRPKPSPQQQPPPKVIVDVSMNLSDSSSEEEDDD